MKICDVPSILFDRQFTYRQAHIEVSVAPDGAIVRRGELKASGVWLVLKTSPEGASSFRSELIVFSDRLSALDLASADRLVTVVACDFGPSGRQKIELIHGSAPLNLARSNRSVALCSAIVGDACMMASIAQDRLPLGPSASRDSSVKVEVSAPYGDPRSVDGWVVKDVLDSWTTDEIDGSQPSRVWHWWTVLTTGQQLLTVFRGAKEDDGWFGVVTSDEPFYAVTMAADQAAR